MKPISKEQIKMIHTLKAALAWPEHVYRGTIYVTCAVRSSKEMDFEQADLFIENMKKLAVRNGVWSADGKQQLLGVRPGFATERQVLYIEGLWRKVTKYKDEKEISRALQAFLLRIVKVSDVRFVRDYQAQKVIEALKAMQEKKIEKSKAQKEQNERLEAFDAILEVGNG